MRENAAEKRTGALLLLLTALIWGSAFVAQSVAMDYVGPFTFCAARFLLSGAALLLFMLLREKLGADRRLLYSPEELRERRLAGVKGGIFCGFFLCAATSLQQFGLQSTEAGKAGFLTALYIVLVPIYSIALGKRPRAKTWAAVLLALAGLYLLCVEGKFQLTRGDLLCILCGMVFPFQILILDYYVPRADAVLISCVEFWTVGILSSALALLTESPELSSVADAGASVLYAGLLSGAVAYTLQGVAQRKMQNPAAASLIMSFEAVFAVLAGWLLIGEALSLRKLLGCAVMFGAILLSQL